MEVRLVILGDSTAALGVAQTRHVLEVVKRLGEQGLAVILISHNLPGGSGRSGADGAEDGRRWRGFGVLRREAATRIRLRTDRRCRELPIRRPSQPQCEPLCWQRPDGTQIVTSFLAIKEQLSETDSGSQFAHLECVASDAHVLRTQLLGADRPLFPEAELDAWGRPRTDGRRPHISTDAPW